MNTNQYISTALNLLFILLKICTRKQIQIQSCKVPLDAVSLGMTCNYTHIPYHHWSYASSVLVPAVWSAVGWLHHLCKIITAAVLPQSLV